MEFQGGFIGREKLLCAIWVVPIRSAKGKSKSDGRVKGTAGRQDDVVDARMGRVHLKNWEGDDLITASRSFLRGCSNGRGGGDSLCVVLPAVI